MSTGLIEPNQPVTLRRVSWRTYESLLEDYAAYKGVRLTYDRGVLEIRSPGPEHENANISFEYIVSNIAVEQDRDLVAYGSTTFRREDLERGFEPDACFYFDNAEEMRGRQTIDLGVDPAPELVIEIDDTSLSLDKLSLFARVGVREVWRYQDGTVTIYGLHGDAYEERTNSLTFPDLTREQLAEFIASSRVLRFSDWVRQIRAWARHRPSL